MPSYSTGHARDRPRNPPARSPAIPRHAPRQSPGTRTSARSRHAPGTLPARPPHACVISDSRVPRPAPVTITATIMATIAVNGHAAITRAPRAPRLNATGPTPRPHRPRVARSPDRWATLTAPVRRALCRTAFQSPPVLLHGVLVGHKPPCLYPRPAARHTPPRSRDVGPCAAISPPVGHPGLPTEVRRTEGRKTAQFRGFPAMRPCERFPAGAQPGAGRFAVPSSRQSFRTRGRVRGDPAG